MSKKNRNRKSSGLVDHKLFKKKLSPPLAQIPKLKPFSWNPDILPEMLLIDAVMDQATMKHAPGAMHAILDELDIFVPEDSIKILTGTISSMEIIPPDKRKEAVSKLKDKGMYETLVPDGLCHGLALYPNCPANWLVSEWQYNNSIDWEKGTSYLQAAVIRLWESQSVYSTRCRMFPIARMAKHGKLSFSSEIESFNLFPKYPNELSEEEQKIVESSTRAMFLAIYSSMIADNLPTWTPYFWRHNYEISPCKSTNDQETGELVSERDIQEVLKKILEASEGFRKIVDTATLKAKLDIYELDRDEIVFGIISRQFRLFRIIASTPSIWTVDISGVFHRIMTDALITVKWLLKKNEAELFRKYKDYSLGKQKLLKLHVQDLVDKGREDLVELEEYLGESINEEIWEEFLSVDLGGHFANKNIREMAHEVDLQDIYNFVYSPASSDIHGEWISLKRHNLVRCKNPLHRFHRLPRLSGSSILVTQAVSFAGQILVDTFKLYLDAYNLDGYEDQLKGFSNQLNTVFE